MKRAVISADGKREMRPALPANADDKRPGKTRSLVPPDISAEIEAIESASDWATAKPILLAALRRL